MNIHFQRFVLFLVFAVLQRSFFDVISPSIAAPVVIISLVVSLIFLEGFERGSLAALFLVGIYFLLGQSDLVLLLSLVFVAYSTGFLSRRLVIERPVQTSFVLALATAGFAITFELFAAYLGRESLILRQFVVMVVQVILIFPPVFFVMKGWEKYIRESAMSEFRGMRT